MDEINNSAKIDLKGKKGTDNEKGYGTKYAAVHYERKV
jgi:hypothetical protein